MLKNVPPFIYVAQALARNVFPVPGGPYNNIPFQGVLCPINTSGCFIGKITAYCNTVLAWSNPETSSHDILGFYLTIAADRSFYIYVCGYFLSYFFYYVFPNCCEFLGMLILWFGLILFLFYYS